MAEKIPELPEPPPLEDMPEAELPPLEDMPEAEIPQLEELPAPEIPDLGEEEPDPEDIEHAMDGLSDEDLVPPPPPEEAFGPSQMDAVGAGVAVHSDGQQIMVDGPPLEDEAQLLPGGSFVDPLDLTVTPGDSSARTGTWDIGNQGSNDGVTVYRERYFIDGASSKLKCAWWYEIYDSSGLLVEVSAETLADIHTGDTC